MSAGTDLAALTRFLERVRLLLWLSRALVALARCAAVASVAVVLNTLVAERSATGSWTVFGLALCGTAALLAAAVRFAPALRLPSRAAAARRVQAAESGLRTDVESSLELGQGAAAGGVPVSRELVGALVGSTAERLAGRPARAFVRWRGLRDGALLLAAALVPLAALALTGGIPGTAVRALVDPRAYWPLGRLSFTVEPGDVRLARGSDLVVRVRTGGARPGAVLVGYEGATGEGAAAMERGPDGVWSWRFVAVTGDFRYRALARGGASGWHQVRAADAPAAGNFDVTYTYPAYSGLGARRVSGGGDLEALRGTTATIEFTSTVELAKAALVAGTGRVAAEPAGGLRYRVALYLGGDTSYRLELEDAQGLGNGGGAEYPIRLLPDAAPTVEVSEPAGEVEGDPRATVLVRYRAADDFGLARLTLVARSAAAGERRHPLELRAGARSAGGEYQWDLAPLAAAPGEVIGAQVEAADNDTISGPKITVSAPIVVRIADPRVRREQLRESMDKLGEDLLQLLADELDLEARYEELAAKAERWEEFPWEQADEAAAAQSKARETAARAEERADRIAEALDRDPAAGEEGAFQAELIREGLAELREQRQSPMADVADSLRRGESNREEALQKTGFLAETAGKAARAAEQLALMAEALQRERRMEDVMRGGQEMAEAEDRLLESLAKLSPGDRKAAEEVLKQLAEIERELQDLAQALQKESGELPEEFLNSEAVKGLDLGEVMDAAAQVREALRRGDIEGARKAARDLAAKLADLRNSLRQGREDVDRRQRQALDRLGGKTLPELQSLAERQRELLERTEAIESQAGPRLERRLREMALARDPAPAPAQADLLTAEERGRVEALAREQEAAREKAGALAAEVEALRGALPFLPPDIGEGLKEAGEFMTEAGRLLGGQEPGRAIPPERLALAALQRARDKAAQAQSDLSQMQGMRQGSSGQPLMMGSGSPGPGSGRDTTRGRRSGGRRGLDVRNFVIPGRQDHEVPKIFREELMKSLRDGYPAQYEERIKDYYQRIAE